MISPTGRRFLAVTMVLASMLAAVAPCAQAEDAGWLEGTVADSIRYPLLGEPIEGALIEVVNTGISTTTDSDGFYNLSVPAGNWTLRYSAEGFRPKTLANVTVKANSTAKRDVHLEEPTGNITGNVTDAETGAPIEYVSVTPEGWYIGDMTEKDGKYLIMSIPAGPVELNASGIGYGHYTFTVDIQADRTITRDIALKPVSHVTVTVKNIDEEALACATVRIGELLGYTDGSGKASFEVKAGNYTMSVSAPGYDNATREITVERRAIQSYETTLVTGYQVVVRVVDFYTEKPIRGATVKFGESTNTTNSSGMAGFLAHWGIEYPLEVSAPGYHDFKHSVNETDTTFIQFAAPLRSSKAEESTSPVLLAAVIAVVLAAAAGGAGALLWLRKRRKAPPGPVPPAAGN